MASTLQTVTGCVDMAFFVIGDPIYLRILYIFVSNKNYRNLECYRIMIQMGLVQQIYTLGLFFFGVLQTWECDPLSLGTHGIKISVACIRTEAFFSLLLALNRLIIICQLKCPKFVFPVLTVLTWLYLVFHHALFSTFWAGYKAVPGYYLAKTNLDLPYSLTFNIVLGSVYETTLICVFGIYVIIVLHLLYVKWKTGILKDMDKESKILVYAGTRFVFDGCLTVFFHYVTFPPVPISSFFMNVLYNTNNTLISPILYLCLYRQVSKFVAKG